MINYRVHLDESKYRTHLRRVSSDRSTHVCRFACERTSGRCAVATVLLSVHYRSHCKNRWGISTDARPNCPYAQPLTPIVYSCSIGPLLVRYFTPVTSIVNTCCHTALHQSTERTRREYVCVYPACQDASVRSSARSISPLLWWDRLCPSSLPTCAERLLRELFVCRRESRRFRIRIVIVRAERAMRLPPHSDDNRPTYITVRAPINLIVFVYHQTSCPNDIYVNR